MASPSIEIVQIKESSPEILDLLHEYYEAINVVVRDTPESIQKIIDDSASGIWIAKLEGESVGCVVLRPLDLGMKSAECKRLYVQPKARGLGLANLLMNALESFASARDYEWIYLDSYRDLVGAITLYQNRGYEECERYNDNPQANIFMRKRITNGQ